MRPRLPIVAGLLFVDMLGFSALIPILPTLRDMLGVSDVAIGLLVAGLPLGTLLVTLPMGRLTDRVGSRAVTIGGAAAVGASFLAFGLLDTYGWLLAVRLMQGFASTALWVGGPAWVALGDELGRGRRMATVTGAGMAGSIVGAGFGGLMASAFGLLSSFVVLGILSLAGAALALAVTSPVGVVHPPTTRLMAAFASGFRSARFRTGATTTLLGAMIGSSEAAVLTLALGDRGFDERRLGLWLSLAGVALVAGQVSGPRIAVHSGVRRTISAAGTGVVVAAGAALLRPTDALLVAALVSIPLCAGLMYGLSLDLLAGGAVAAGSSAAIGISWWNLSWAVGAAVGPVLITASLQRGGTRVALGMVVALGISVIATAVGRPRAASA